jgi:hypothetical protein
MVENKLITEKETDISDESKDFRRWNLEKVRSIVQ